MNSKPLWPPPIHMIWPCDPPDREEPLFKETQPDETLHEFLVKELGLQVIRHRTETLADYRDCVQDVISVGDDSIIYLDAHGSRDEWGVSSRRDREVLDMRPITEVGGVFTSPQSAPLLVILGMCDAACGTAGDSSRLSAFEWVATWIGRDTVVVGATGTSVRRDTRRLASIIRHVATKEQAPRNTDELLPWVREAMSPRTANRHGPLTRSFNYGPVEDRAGSTWVARVLSGTTLRELRPKWTVPRDPDRRLER